MPPLLGSSVAILAKVKFRLKRTQLETLLNSCPEGNLMGREPIVQGILVQGGLFRGNCEEGRQLSWGKSYREDCLGVFCPGDNYLGVIIRRVIAMGVVIQRGIAIESLKRVTA